MRTWAAVGGFAAALGPLVGGVLVTASWRWIFLVNVPIGLTAMVVAWFRLPNVPGHAVPLPSAGAALMVTGGIGALTLAIVKANDWGWESPGIVLCVVFAGASLFLFVRHCLGSANPFVDPALFRIRHFTGAALVMAPYSVAFGAMLFSVAQWEQVAWGWSALQTGLAIAPGPLLVPFTSLLFAGRLIARFGTAAVVTAGIFFLTAGLICWAALISLAADPAVIVAGMVMSGIGVGLTFPTLMGIGTSSLPTSSFATGSGVINMIRQAAIAIGVAIFVAIVKSPATALERVAVFHRGWWIMAGISAAGLIPTFHFLRVTRADSRSRD